MVGEYGPSCFEADLPLWTEQNRSFHSKTCSKSIIIQRPILTHISSLDPHSFCRLLMNPISKEVTFYRHGTSYHSIPTLNNLRKKPFENLSEKGENAGDQHFLLFFATFSNLPDFSWQNSFFY